MALPHGGEAQVPYASIKLAADEGRVVARAAPGHTFPKDAQALSIVTGGFEFTAADKFPQDARAAAPAPEFSVVGFSPDKTRMRVAAPDDGSFPQGPAEIKVRLSNKAEESMPYSLVLPARATAGEVLLYL